MRRAIIVVPTANLAAANAALRLLDPAGASPLSVPLYDGAGALAAYWCSWSLADAEFMAVEAAVVTSGLGRVYDGNVTLPGAVLAAEGLHPAEA